VSTSPAPPVKVVVDLVTGPYVVLLVSVMQKMRCVSQDTYEAIQQDFGAGRVLTVAEANLEVLVALTGKFVWLIADVAFAEWSIFVDLTTEPVLGFVGMRVDGLRGLMNDLVEFPEEVSIVVCLEVVMLVVKCVPSVVKITGSRPIA
jgi:hypothetical protein